MLALTARRFWESEDGIFGGGTYTDLPTGITYYPADNAGARDPKVSARPAVMLHASLAHTWMQGALESALRAVRDILSAS